jgi:uncharacterized membrane protein YvlD (DUF360 family)
MGAILQFGLFCCLVVAGVVAGLLAGLPDGPTAAVGVWAVSLGAIVTVLLRFVRGKTRR